MHHKTFEEQNGMGKTKNNIKYWIRICEIEWNFHEKKIRHLVTIQQVDFSQNRSIHSEAMREIKREKNFKTQNCSSFICLFLIHANDSKKIVC